MPNKKLKSGMEVVYPSAIVLTKSHFGETFSQFVKLRSLRGPVSANYLHISTSVVTGGYDSDPNKRAAQLKKYNEFIQEAAKEFASLSDTKIETGYVKKTSFSSPGGEVEERIELEIKSPEIARIIQKLEENIKSTGLVCADKSGALHVTIASGQGRDSVDPNEWSTLQNQRMSLSNASFSMVDYPPKLAGKTDFSRVDLVTDSPVCNFIQADKATDSVSAALPFGELVSNPIPFDLPKGIQINSVQGVFDRGVFLYYLATYNTGVQARIYPNKKLTNGNGTSELGENSPLRQNFTAFLAHFFIKKPTAGPVEKTSATSSISPTLAAGIFSSTTKKPFVLFDEYGNNEVLGITRDDVRKCFLVHGKNSSNEERTLCLFDDGATNIGDGLTVGVVRQQMFENRAEIFKYFGKELPPAHQPKQVKPK